jgi:methionine synthase II (cobalamin-independent)
VSDPGWPATVAATGVGSLPGVDPLAAATWVLDELADLPHLPELPDRGLGADAIGRTAGLLVDLPVEATASGWQIAGRPGVDLATARGLLNDDLAALEIAAHGYRGPLKVQVVGPITLAASLGRPLGEAAVSDVGLLRDLTASLAEGVRQHLADVAARVPGADLVLQIDEPSLPLVLAGRLRTRSGWGLLSRPERHVAQMLLADVLAAAPGARGVHCCGSQVPIDLVVAAGADAVSFDLDLMQTAELDGLAAAVEAGTRLVVGAVPTARASTSAAVADRVAGLWSRLGFGTSVMHRLTVVSPACGMAGRTVQQARAAYRTAREAAAELAERDSVGPPE